MIEEALKLIQETACNAQTTEVLANLNTDGRTEYIRVGGDIKAYPLSPPVRSHTVHSLVDLILYARQRKNASPVVWHGANGVMLVTNDDDRRDRVGFPLSFSQRFTLLGVLAQQKPLFDQAKFIRLMRIDLGLDNLKVVAKFRKLDWAMNDSGSAEIQHGSGKMGKAIMAKVQGIDELPDELDVEVPVYQQTGERQTYVVKCAIEIDTVNRQFQLVPMPDELERVLDLAQADLHKRLTAALGTIEGKDGIDVFYGEP